MRTKLVNVLAVSTMLAAGGLIAVWAGPPMVCHPIEIGESNSLPMKKSGGEIDPKFDKSNLVKETLKVLKTQESVLARMETLRRATVYARQDKQQAHDLLARLAFIALDAEASGKSSWASKAWYDAGYLAACYQQYDLDIDWNPGVANGIHGYAWMKKALSTPGATADMQFGAALATAPEMRPEKIVIDGENAYDYHMRLAVAGAQPGSLLESNITHHLKNWGRSIEQVRASAAKKASTHATGPR